MSAKELVQCVREVYPRMETLVRGQFESHTFMK